MAGQGCGRGSHAGPFCQHPRKAEQMDVRRQQMLMALGGGNLRLGFCGSLRRNLGGDGGGDMYGGGQNVATARHPGPPNFKRKDLEAFP